MYYTLVFLSSFIFPLDLTIKTIVRYCKILCFVGELKVILLDSYFNKIKKLKCKRKKYILFFNNGCSTGN